MDLPGDGEVPIGIVSIASCHFIYRCTLSFGMNNVDADSYQLVQAYCLRFYRIDQLILQTCSSPQCILPSVAVALLAIPVPLLI